MKINIEKENRIAIKGHDNPDFDSVVSGILCCSYLKKLGYSCRYCLPSITDKPTLLALSHAGVDILQYISDIEDDEVLFLVDHHETNLKNTVVGCIDHHPTVKECSYPFYHNVRSSSCAVEILRMMTEAGIEVDEQEYYLAVFSVYMDTMSLRSSKLNESDVIWIGQICNRLGFDTGVMINDGLALTDIGEPVELIAQSNLKYYKFGSVNVASSDIHAKDLPPRLLNKITEHIESIVSDEKNGIDMWVLIIMNPVDYKTDVIKISGRGNITYEHHERLLSRSHDVMPAVEKTFI